MLDHRKATSISPHPDRVSELARPLQCPEAFATASGGLRSAATTGYYLTALQAAQVSPSSDGRARALVPSGNALIESAPRNNEPVPVPQPQTKRPAIVFVHGGPPRQMLLGWHYMRLLLERLRHEPVPGQPRLHRALRELPAAVSATATIFAPATRRAGRLGISGRAGRRRIYCAPSRSRSRNASAFTAALTAASSPPWRSRATLTFRRRRRHPRRPRLDRRACATLLTNRYEKTTRQQRALDVAWQSSPVSSIATWKSQSSDSRRRRSQRRFSQTTDWSGVWKRPACHSKSS